METTVQTVPVEIKTVKVGKRQMTLSMFKQIPDGEIQLVNNGMYFLPTDEVWGIVRAKGHRLDRENAEYALFVRDGTIYKEELGAPYGLRSRIIDLKRREADECGCSYSDTSDMAPQLRNLPQLYIAV